MPISSSNDLPHCSLLLGQSRSALCLSVLFDTGAALSTGYLPAHMKIMKDNPKAVHSFEKFDGPEPFDPIKLTGAISNSVSYDAEKHGVLSAVVRYYTPYCDQHGNRLLIPVALDMDMAVDTILGNTVINQWQMELKYNPPMITSHKLRETFELKYHPTQLSQNTLALTASANTTIVEDKVGKVDPTDIAKVLISSLHQISNSSGSEKERNVWV